jgi:hypothetical protein
MTEDTQPAEAVQALRARGVDSAETLLAHATPAAILRTCEWYDRQSGVGAGLLVMKCRGGGIHEVVAAAGSAGADDALIAELIQRGGQVPEQHKKLRDRVYRGRFERYVTRHPVGSVVESHAELEARAWPDDETSCGGDMLVIAAVYPNVELECDKCGFAACIPAARVPVVPAAPAANLRLAS